MLHLLILSQCLTSSDSIVLLLQLTAPLTTTTTSFPSSCFCLKRKLSLMILFNLFRSTDLDICFLGTAKPRRACLRSFCLARNKNDLSLERCFEENTSLNSSGRFNLLQARKPPSKEDTLYKNYAESLFLPLLRRALMINLPERLCMRARKPWFLFRLILLGWNVRFIYSCLRLLCGAI